MKKLIKGLALIGVGAAAALAVVNRKKIKNEVDSLVKKGKIKANEGKKFAAKLVDDAKKQQKVIEAKVKAQAEKLVQKAGVVTKNQADALQKKIKQLEAKLKASKKKK